jgi:hypothetical protein
MEDTKKVLKTVYLCQQQITLAVYFKCLPGSVFSVVIGYGLDGPGSNPGGGQDFLRLSRPALGPTQPPVQLVLGLSWG